MKSKRNLIYKFASLFSSVALLAGCGDSKECDLGDYFVEKIVIAQNQEAPFLVVDYNLGYNGCNELSYCPLTSLYIDDSFIGSIQPYNIVSGARECNVSELFHSRNDPVLKPGKHTAKVIIDPNNTIPESNENNNFKTLDYIVSN